VGQTTCSTSGYPLLQRGFLWLIPHAVLFVSIFFKTVFSLVSSLLLTPCFILLPLQFLLQATPLDCSFPLFEVTFLLSVCTSMIFPFCLPPSFFLCASHPFCDPLYADPVASSYDNHLPVRGHVISFYFLARVCATPCFSPYWNLLMVMTLRSPQRWVFLIFLILKEINI